MNCLSGKLENLEDVNSLSFHRYFNLCMIESLNIIYNCPVVHQVVVFKSTEDQLYPLNIIIVCAIKIVTNHASYVFYSEEFDDLF